VRKVAGRSRFRTTRRRQAISREPGRCQKGGDRSTRLEEKDSKYVTRARNREGRGDTSVVRPEAGTGDRNEKNTVEGDEGINACFRNSRNWGTMVTVQEARKKKSTDTSRNFTRPKVSYER